MGWFYLILALVVLGVNDYFIYKYGQKTVLKVLQEYHLSLGFAQNVRADFASFIANLKRDFHL